MQQCKYDNNMKILFYLYTKISFFIIVLAYLSIVLKKLLAASV